MTLQQFERITRPPNMSSIPREVLEAQPGYAEARQQEIDRRLAALRAATERKTP
jgi:hypothetical protein